MQDTPIFRTLCCPFDSSFSRQFFDLGDLTRRNRGRMAKVRTAAVDVASALPTLALCTDGAIMQDSRDTQAIGQSCKCSFRSWCVAGLARMA